MSSDRGAPLRGHRRPGFNRCLVCNQKVQTHSDGINVGEGLVHVKACARKYAMQFKSERDRARGYVGALVAALEGQRVHHKAEDGNEWDCWCFSPRTQTRHDDECFAVRAVLAGIPAELRQAGAPAEVKP